jgi:hypothetical protein
MALQDYYNSAQDGYNNIFEDQTIAQTFTANADYSISSVKLLLDRYSTVTSVTVSIQETTAGAPNGSVLATKTITGSTVQLTPTLIEFIFAAAVALTMGTVYAIVLTVVTTNNGEIDWYYSLQDGGYAGGSKWYYDTDAWYADTEVDYIFETYGEGGSNYVDLEGTVAGIGAIIGILTKKFTNSNVATNSRLVAAGSNQIWYEDI